MQADDFRALVDDIRLHGQRDPATLNDGMVIDGWHRYRACEELGIPCRFDEFAGADAVAFVRSKNQHRRHYQKSQQAAIEVSLTAWAEAHRPKKGEAASPFSTNKAMADRAGTTERTIQHAKRAHEAGLGEAVRDGKISAERASEIAKADPELAKQVAHGEVSLPAAVEKITGKRPGSKPAPELVIEDDGPSAEEIAEAEAAAADDAERVRLILESDNALAAMTEKCKQQAAQIRILEERVRGLTNEAAQAIRLAKSWRTKFERLEKAAA